jgi:hypothetical protein
MSKKIETIRFLLEVKRREDGALFTSHRPATPGDLDRMATWPSEGLHQIAHALFVEALRREAYTLVISKMAQGEDVGAMVAKDLDTALRARYLEMVDQFSMGAIQNALEAAKK